MKRYALRSTRVVLPEDDSSPHGAQRVTPATVLVADGRIAAVYQQGGSASVPDGVAVTDLGSLVLAPGRVDINVHLCAPGRDEWGTFVSGTAAAAAGGTTTLLDQPIFCVPPTTTASRLAEKVDAARKNIWVDCGFFGGAVGGGTEDDWAEMIDAGAFGLVAHLSHCGEPAFPPVTSSELCRIVNCLRHCASTATPPMLLVHAERYSDKQLELASPLRFGPPEDRLHADAPDVTPRPYGQSPSSSANCSEGDGRSSASDDGCGSGDAVVTAAVAVNASSSSVTRETTVTGSPMVKHLGTSAKRVSSMWENRPISDEEQLKQRYVGAICKAELESFGRFRAFQVPSTPGVSGKEEAQQEVGRHRRHRTVSDMYNFRGKGKIVNSGSSFPAPGAHRSRSDSLGNHSRVPDRGGSTNDCIGSQGNRETNRDLVNKPSSVESKRRLLGSSASAPDDVVAAENAKSTAHRSIVASSPASHSKLNTPIDQLASRMSPPGRLRIQSIGDGASKTLSPRAAEKSLKRLAKIADTNSSSLLERRKARLATQSAVGLGALPNKPSNSQETGQIAVRGASLAGALSLSPKFTEGIENESSANAETQPGVFNKLAPIGIFKMYDPLSRAAMSRNYGLFLSQRPPLHEIRAVNSTLEVLLDILSSGDVSEGDGIGLDVLGWHTDEVLALKASKAADCWPRVHFIDVSSATAVSALERCSPQVREAFKPTASLAPHHLAIDSERITPGKVKVKVNPPIRDPANRRALWDLLLGYRQSIGSVDAMISAVETRIKSDPSHDTFNAHMAWEAQMKDSSDFAPDAPPGYEPASHWLCCASGHLPCAPSLKSRDGDFNRAFGGVSCLQLALPVLWSAAREHNAGVAQLFEWTSSRPALLAGLKRKGAIAPGLDADFVVFDPETSFEARAAMLLSPNEASLSPYLFGELERRELFGVVVATYLRGHCVFSGRELVPLETEEDKQVLPGEVLQR